MQLTRIKIYLAVLFALIFGALFIYFNQYTTAHISRSADIHNRLKSMESIEYRISNELFETSFLLYRDYDRLEFLLNELRNNLKKLESNDYINGPTYKKTRISLQAYRVLIDKKDSYIQDFKTLNSPIKNSSMYLATLVIELQSGSSEVDDSTYQLLISSILSSIYLYRSSFEEDFIQDLTRNLKRLKRYNFRDRKREEIHRLFVAHTKVFLDNYSLYHSNLEKARSSDSVDHLMQTVKIFNRENKTAENVILVFSIVFTLGFFTAIALIIYFLLRSEKENKQLARMTEDLAYLIEYDALTGLLSRKSYERDFPHIQKPVCILVNIDSFKHINDFYGNAAGDSILKDYGNLLRQVQTGIECKTSLYRLGVDDFAFVYDEDDLSCKELEMEIAAEIIEVSDSAFFNYAGVEIPIRVTIGISRGDRLLEKADMVLKYVKNHTRLRFLEYEEELNLEEVIQKNIQLLHYLKRSLEENRLIPFYHPIVDNRTGNISKYECLARFRNHKGDYSLPSELFRVAKESRFYSTITRRMIDMSFNYFETRDFDFSLNISIEDIMDKDLNEFLLWKINQKPDVSNRLILEILESESVSNYDVVRKFIKDARKMNCRIAVDDFGSGYSNFSHVVNLDLDIVKIDGELIRNIHYDDNSRMIVKTIVEFCHQRRIQTVAEFVHNKSVYEVVCALGVDYSQGFYFSHPLIDVSHPMEPSI